MTCSFFCYAHELIQWKIALGFITFQLWNQNPRDDRLDFWISRSSKYEDYFLLINFISTSKNENEKVKQRRKIRNSLESNFFRWVLMDWKFLLPLTFSFLRTKFIKRRWSSSFEALVIQKWRQLSFGLRFQSWKTKKYPEWFPLWTNPWVLAGP